MGNTSSGKSTTIHYLNEIDFEFKFNDEKKIK